MFYSYRTDVILYYIEDDVISMSYPMSNYSHYYLLISYFILSRQPEITYNTNQQITKITIPGNEWNANRVIEVTYNEQGKPLTINHYNGAYLYRKFTYSYLPDGIHCNRFEYYLDSWADGNWSLEYNSETVFDNNGEALSVTGWKSGSNWFRYEFKYNGDREISRYDYIGAGDKWGLTQYVIRYYSDIPDSPNVEVENNNPVGNENMGNFDIDVNIPIDSISNGSITITFPEGFTLDEKNTSLTLDFAELFDLIITKQDNNSWLFEIKPKTLKSASLRTDEVKKMLQVAYTVDEMLQRGTYNISVNSILFETKGGNYIPEPAITVPAQLNRWGVSNAVIENNSIWISEGNLYIRTDKPCTLFVYTVYGQLFRHKTISAGETILPLPQGIYFVKVGETTKKIITK